MNNSYLTLFSVFISTTLLAQNILEPDSYSEEGYCIVKTQSQKHIGLTRFKTNLQFIQQCKGKMFFIYKDDVCRFFTMKKMHFDIYIQDKKEKTLFKIGQIKEVCGKTIIEESTSLNHK